MPTCKKCGNEFVKFNSLDKCKSIQCRATPKKKATTTKLLKRKALKNRTKKPVTRSKVGTTNTVIKSEKLRKSANGESCTFEIAGKCNGNPETTVLCHLPSEIAGSKSTDLSSAYGCSSCHSVIDSRGTLSAEDYEFYCRRAQVRTITRFEEKGLVRIL